VGPRSAVLSWQEVDPESVRGEFKGYKIKTWTDETGKEKAREIIMRRDSARHSINSLKPFATNYAVIYAFNGAYNGPPSNEIVIRTPEGKPGPVDELNCFPMGSSALLLAWKKPEEVNGILNGYRIYYQQVDGTKLGPLLERKPRINDAKTDKAKIAGLKPYQKYRITIKATTGPGEGMPYYTECETNEMATVPPSRPRGKYSLLNPSGGYARVKVTWQPQIDGDSNPGSHFYVQYKKETEPMFLDSPEELNKNSVVIRGLDYDLKYLFRVVAVDGALQTPSETETIYTYSVLPSNVLTDPESAVQSLEHARWFIGMLLAVIFLVLVCIVVCVIKRNRGGKYAVQEREERQGRRDPYDEGGFPEYTQPLDDRHMRSSVTSDLKMPPESDNDSIAAYEDGENQAGMAEDGSFIGKYNKDRNPEQSSAFETHV